MAPPTGLDRPGPVCTVRRSTFPGVRIGTRRPVDCEPCFVVTATFGVVCSCPGRRLALRPDPPPRPPRGCRRGTGGGATAGDIAPWRTTSELGAGEPPSAASIAATARSSSGLDTALDADVLASLGESRQSVSPSTGDCGGDRNPAPALAALGWPASSPSEGELHSLRTMDGLPPCAGSNAEATARARVTLERTLPEALESDAWLLPLP